MVGNSVAIRFEKSSFGSPFHALANRRIQATYEDFLIQQQRKAALTTARR
jgi:hypothetical protein